MICCVLVFSAFELKAAVVGGIFWVASLYGLRLMAKKDPQMRFVYLRSLKYEAYYPAQSTPFYENAREYK
ncbi:IncP-type conjugative transfer protein TrbD [Metapseudomonas furukawaii]|uniref:IncP-type conjugative transfer protein n=2 Tax=Metapseudomonas furukawaii TaxID=1149133 RepID=A0AAD1C6K9_METFU|nr:IncP-type conjugative transfer protein TrbD [Pseudomonas furukawaii]BAU77403.1 IncP-type conjugative transfer protein [Pseudomonas furukawaii]